MLHYFALISSVAIVFTDMVVMALGDWRKLGLKFAAVALSTAAGVWLTLLYFSLDDILRCEAMRPLCFTGEIYHIVRNCAFVLFHISVGRDAIHLKKRDRRVP